MPITPTSARRRVANVHSDTEARKPTRKNEKLIERVAQKWNEGPPVGELILAIDPGGSTGIAVRFPDGQFQTNTLTDPADLWDFFKPAVKPQVCVFEMFSTAGRVDKYMIYTIELVGGLRAITYALGIRSYVHVPSKRYPWLAQAEALLKGKGHTRHEVDALAHLLAYEGRRPNV